MIRNRSLCTFVQVLSNNTLYPLHIKVGALRAISNKYHGDDVIGIDLGTKNAHVAVMLGAVPTVIETVSGHTTPSLVAVDGVKGILVGEAAKSHPNLLYRMRDLIGRRYDDPQTQKLKSMVPFNIYGDENGNSLVEVSNKYFSVTEVCSFILDEMKKTAELYLGRTISTAVISVPSDFSESQRREMELAGNKVGLKEIHLIKEPVAAIVASKRQNGVFITFTMGAGKFDVSVFEVHDGVIKVKAQCGDRSLGGDDFDIVLANHLAEEIKRVHDVDLTSDRTAMTRLKEAAEEAKIRLSHFPKTLVRGYFWSGRGPVNVNIAISRSEFEGLVDDMIQKARTLCDKCLKDAKTTGVYEIDEVFLVGGMTRVPAVQKIVQEIFKQSPSTDFKPEEAVVLGATFYGALKREEKNILLPGSLPLSIGVETWGATFTKIVPRNSKLPAKGSQTFTTEYDNQGSLVFRILYGEGWSMNSSATKFLGELEFKGIPPDPQGLPRVELTCEIDEAGNLCASAKLGGVEQLVSIKVPLDLSHEYVWKLVRSAVLNGPTEIQQYRLAKLRLKSSTLIYRLGSSLSRKEEKIQEQLRSEAHSTIMELKALIGSQDVYQLTKKMYDVMQLNREIILEAFQDESDDDDRDGYSSG